MSEEDKKVGFIQKYLPESGSDWEVRYEKNGCDIALYYNGNPAVAVEFKDDVKNWKTKKNDKKETPIEQAKRYAREMKFPIALATNGKEFIYHHMATDESLKYSDGTVFGKFLSIDEFLMFKNKPQLKKQSKSDIAKYYKEINDNLSALGVGSGITRAIEAAKITFIKLLCEREIILNKNDWTCVANAQNPKIVINQLIERVSREKAMSDKIEELKLNMNDQKKPLQNIVKIISKFDLSSTNADVQGDAFQYFQNDKAAGKGKTDDLGQYFTPKWVIDGIVNIAKADEKKTIYDPFCGTGGILINVFKNVAGELKLKQKNEYAQKHLYGTELSAAATVIAKMNMILAGDGHSNIEMANSISSMNKFIQQDKKFDLVITNMPFAPKNNDEEDLEDYYHLTSSDGKDIEKCIEHCINRTKQGGKAVMIVPKGFLEDNTHAEFRKNLCEKYKIDLVVQLPPATFEPYTKIRSCIFCVSKEKRMDGDSTITFCDITKPAELKDLTQTLNGERPAGSSLAMGEVDVGDILNNSPHVLSMYQYYAEPKNKLTELATLVVPRDVKVGELEKVGLKFINVPTDESTRTRECSEGNVRGGGDTYNFKLQEGAIVVKNIVNSRQGEEPVIGVSLVADADVGHLITQEYHQIVPKNPEHLAYLYFYLKSDEWQNTIIKRGTGTGMQRIGKHLNSVEIPAPTKSQIEQSKELLARIQETEDTLVKLLASKSSILKPKKDKSNG